MSQTNHEENHAKDDHEKSLRDHLVELLRGEHAHVDFAGALRDVPAGLRGARPAGAEHSLWQLLEHLRLAQSDILGFSRDPSHVSPKWPEGYWSSSVEPPGDGAWDASVAAFRTDLQAMVDLVSDPAADLFTPFAHGKGQTLLREAMLTADHNAYHVGQVVTLRRLLGDWPPAAG